MPSSDWYVELWKANSIKADTAKNMSYEQTVAFTKENLKDGQIVRFIAPSSALDDELYALEKLGAVRNG